MFHFHCACFEASYSHLFSADELFDVPKIAVIGSQSGTCLGILKVSMP